MDGDVGTADVWRARLFNGSCRCTLSYYHRCWLSSHGGPKNQTHLNVDNLAVVSGRNAACDMARVLECCRDKSLNLHTAAFKYSLLVIFIHPVYMCI